jgi:hypothetical protein
MTLGRRAFLVIAALVSPLARAAAAWQPRAISLDEFIAWSSRLTGHNDLNRQAADTMLKALLATPASAAKLAQPDAAFEREIIVAWYTGAHDVRGQHEVATHAGALKWRALGIPPPGQCAGRFGAWSQRPAGH